MKAPFERQRQLGSWGQWRSHGGILGLEIPFVANMTSYLVKFIRILQNLYFIYRI